MRNLEDIAKDVVNAWVEWCATEGWDNPAYDALADGLNELEDKLGLTPKEPS